VDYLLIVITTCWSLVLADGVSSVCKYLPGYCCWF